ncbi:NADH dehydrogenase [ubiquinone] 1 beta subcomplex subunit 8, mitochondrial [Chelonus insularis]|uniref:NADH dehydrogenase [ubiquinone] 1 beta subcomplex subunit 8, mitochondrial n=1 Tax=Chelonus insularis TaxID=460826 RepID=UPI00158D7C06|nr:NADH dehydrogenase [ubiquinone] 1 beta subcomplex subunit 8, mitochondrial [Chelonus insularis]
MATLAKIKNLVIPLASAHNRVLFNAVRNKVMTNFDYMPGPYPKTEEERIQAAKKYGLHPAEYKPYPEDGLIAPGDYPELPMIAVSQKDINYPWDDPDERRNYEEPIHFNMNLLQEDKTDIGEIPFYEDWKVPLYFLAYMIGGWVIFSLAWKLPRFQPRMEKQMPFGKTGRKHYTFEPAK